MKPEQITISDRIITAGIASFVTAIMTLCVPIGFVILSRGKGLNLLGVFGSFHIWGISLITISGLLGASLGSDRTIDLFSHLWGTHEPRRLEITAFLWLIVTGIGWASCQIFEK